MESGVTKEIMKMCKAFRCVDLPNENQKVYRLGAVLGETLVHTSYVTSREGACTVHQRESRVGYSVAKFYRWGSSLVHVEGVELQYVYSEHSGFPYPITPYSRTSHQALVQYILWCHRSASLPAVTNKLKQRVLFTAESINWRCLLKPRCHKWLKENFASC